MNGSRSWRIRAALLGFWLLPAVIGTIGFHLVPSRLNPDLPTASLFLSQFVMWGTWGLWTALIWYVGDRIPFRAGQRLRALVVHLLLGAAIVFVQIFVYARTSVAFGLDEPRGFESTLVIGIRSYGDVFLVIVCAIVVAQMAMRWYEEWQAGRVLAARMSEDLAQAQLRALQAQLNPHFLFNALNSIVTLIGRDPALAQQLVVRLADLLRATLRAGDGQVIALTQELEFTRRYLDIELVRFADRLRVGGRRDQHRTRWCRRLRCNRWWKMRCCMVSLGRPVPASCPSARHGSSRSWCCVFGTPARGYRPTPPPPVLVRDW